MEDTDKDFSDGGRAGFGEVDSDGAVRANRTFWNEYRGEYLADHGDFLGEADLLWCPEGLREDTAHLLGDVAGRTVLEVGCGAAQGSRWVSAHGGHAIGVDLSDGMLAAARSANERASTHPVLLQADARALPLADDSIDIAFTAFGAIPFLAEIETLHREVCRTLRGGGRWVFSTSHPIRWAFLDDPTEAGLTARRSYFDRRPYRELDDDGRLAYAEFHHTLADHLNAVAAAALRVEQVIEPEWTHGVTQTWGGWSELRARFLPGTLIVVASKPAG